MNRLLFIFILFLCFDVHAQISPWHEFRAVWVATVNNIDWPSKPGLSTDQQKKEVIDILNMHHKNGMNAIIMQIRTTSTVPEWKDPNQLIKQIQITRQIPQIGGSAFYSSVHFNRDLFGFAETLQNRMYKYLALVPSMPWIDKAPAQPKRFRKRGHKLKWKVRKTDVEMDKAAGFLVYLNKVGQQFDANNPENIFTIITDKSIVFKPNSRKLRQKYEIRISALDRLHNESEISKVKIIKL